MKRIRTDSSKGTSPLVRELSERLAARGTVARAEGEKRYLKSPLDFIGVDAAGLRATAREFLKEHPELSDRDLLDIVSALWETTMHELRSVGVALLERRPEALRPSDIFLLEGLLRKAGTWAHVDWIAVRFVGPLVDANPSLAARLDRWSKDPDFWIRRSAILSLIIPLREGRGDWERLERYSDAMLEETEFFIRKAIGWALREAGKKQPERVREYVSTRLPRLSGVTFREAVKPLAPADRERLQLLWRKTRKVGGL